MRKIDNFERSLRVMHKVDYDEAVEDEIYRMGVIGQFNLTFELAWKALQEIMRQYGVSEAETGSPRDIIKMAYARGFLSDEERWLLMLRKRNTTIHIYDEEKADELLILIRDTFIPSLDRLKEDLRQRMENEEEYSSGEQGTD